MMVEKRWRGRTGQLGTVRKHKYLCSIRRGTRLEIFMTGTSYVRTYV